VEAFQSPSIVERINEKLAAHPRFVGRNATPCIEEDGTLL